MSNPEAAPVTTPTKGQYSTDDRGQDPENQLAQLRQWCASAGHQIVEEYVDLESGRSAKRKRFTALFDDAHLLTRA
jgi:DNA invertase Pin-like site-specific DNA recombinase